MQTPGLHLARIGLDDIGTYGVLGAVVGNSAGQAFTLSWMIEANVGNGWQAINSILQNIANDVDTVSSFATGFYVEPVPIPAAAWLFGSALLGLGVMKRRRS